MVSIEATDDIIAQDPVPTIGVPNYWDTDLAKGQYQFFQAHTRAAMALEAAKCTIISNEEAAAVIRAFLDGGSDCGA